MDFGKIRGAVARGWTYPANEKKIMDTDLAEAISIEIEKLFISEKIIQLDSALQKAKSRAAAEGIDSNCEAMMADLTPESPK